MEGFSYSAHLQGLGHDVLSCMGRLPVDLLEPLLDLVSGVGLGVPAVAVVHKLLEPICVCVFVCVCVWGGGVILAMTMVMVMVIVRVG